VESDNPANNGYRQNHELVKTEGVFGSVPVERTRVPAGGRFVAALFLAAAQTSSCLLGCDRKPPPPERSEPWRAPVVASAPVAKPGAALPYTLAQKQEIAFTLKTQATTITGVFPIVRGTLALDPVNLKNSDAKLRIDLGAVRITTGSEDENRGYSVSAQNWLNLGASIPEATRDARRWATLLLEEVQETEAKAAHEATVDRKRLAQLRAELETTPDTSDADAATEADTPPDAASPRGSAVTLPAEIRTTRVRVLGSLELNGRRVTEPYAVTLEFYYPATATPGVPPDRIVVRSVGTHKFPLERYQISPRNPAGMLVASDLKLLGAEVARAAQVHFALQFVPRASGGTTTANDGT